MVEACDNLYLHRPDRLTIERRPRDVYRHVRIVRTKQM